MTTVVSSILIVCGTAFALLAGIGLQRFPDVFARMHAATKPATLGLVLVLGGTALQLDRAGEIAKIVLVIALQFVTAPVGAHMVGRAAYRAGTEMSDATVLDELAVSGGRAFLSHPQPPAGGSAAGVGENPSHAPRWVPPGRGHGPGAGEEEGR